MSVWWPLALSLCLNTPESSAAVPDTILLNQVEVVAKVSVFARAERHQLLDSLTVKEAKTLALSEVLSLNSPVFIRENGYGGIATASFRGTTANHTLVLWNGALINGPQLGQVDFSTIPMFLVDQLTVQSGTSDFHHSTGIGGVVSVNSIPDMAKKLKLSLVQSAGSYGSYGSFAGISASNGSFQARLRAFNKTSRNDFEYLNTALWPQQRMENHNAGYKVKGFQQELFYRNKKSLLSFVSWNQWDNRQLPPIMTNVDRGGKPEEYQNSRFSRNALSWKYFSDYFVLTARSNLLFDFQHYYLKTSSSFPPYAVVSLIDSQNNSLAWQNYLSLSRKIGRHKIETSLQYDRDRVESNNYASLFSRQFFAASATTESDFASGISLNLGLRFDQMDFIKASLSPKIGLAFTPKKWPELKTGLFLAKVRRFPTMNDMYWFPGGNPSLLPETALQASAFAAFQKQFKAVISESRLTIHASEIQNWIQWRPSSYRYWIPENIALVYARGIEFYQSVGYEHNSWAAQLKAHYSLTFTTDESEIAKQKHYAGNQLIYIPKHHANLNLRINWNKIYANIGVEFVGERRTTFDDDLDVFGFLPPYQFLNMGFGYSWQSFELNLKINNLTNADYQAVMWRPMPGRNFEFVLSYLFNKKFVE